MRTLQSKLQEANATTTQTKIFPCGLFRNGHACHKGYTFNNMMGEPVTLKTDCNRSHDMSLPIPRDPTILASATEQAAIRANRAAYKAGKGGRGGGEGGKGSRGRGATPPPTNPAIKCFSLNQNVACPKGDTCQFSHSANMITQNHIRNRGYGKTVLCRQSFFSCPIFFFRLFLVQSCQGAW